MIILDYNKFDLISEIDYLFNNEWFFRVKKENNNIVISSNFFRPVFYYDKDKKILTKEAIEIIDFWIKNKYLTDEDIIKNYNYNKKMLLDKWS